VVHIAGGCTGPGSGFVTTPAHHPKNYRTAPAGHGAANACTTRATGEGFVTTRRTTPENYRTTPAGSGAANCGSITIWLFIHTGGEGCVSTGERGENIARNPLKRDILAF